MYFFLKEYVIYSCDGKADLKNHDHLSIETSK